MELFVVFDGESWYFHQKYQNFLFFVNFKKISEAQNSKFVYEKNFKADFSLKKEENSLRFFLNFHQNYHLLKMALHVKIANVDCSVIMRFFRVFVWNFQKILKFMQKL